VKLENKSREFICYELGVSAIAIVAILEGHTIEVTASERLYHDAPIVHDERP